jgi:hypothetical protein
MKTPTKYKRVRTFVYDEESRFEYDLNQFLEKVINPVITFQSSTTNYNDQLITTLTAFVEYEVYEEK